MKQEDVPRDRYNLVYIVFYLMGVGNLMPWNFFINVQSYWDYKFRDVNDDLHYQNGTHESSFIQFDDSHSHGSASMLTDDPEKKRTALQLSFNSYLSMTNMIPNLLMLFINATLGHKFPMRPRLFVSLVGICVLFIFTDVMTRVNTDSYQYGFLSLTLVTVVFITMCVGVLQGGLAGLAGQFPEKYMGSLVQGQAVGGIVTAIINIISIEGSTDPTLSAFYCFLVATIFIAFDVGAFVAMTKTPFYEYYKQKKSKSHQDVSQEETGLTESQGEESSIIRSQNNSKEDENHPKVNGHTIVDANEASNAVSDDKPLINPETPPIPSSTWFIIKKIWVWIVSVFITFVICLSIFPSITAIVESTGKGKGNKWNDIYFTPVGCFLIFNIGDYIGRFLASILKWPKATRSGSIFMLLFSISRVAFIPLFLFCNASPMNRVNTQVYIESDEAFMILIALLSISNGYIGNIVMMFGPKMLDKPEDQGRAASLLVFFLVLGLTVGALLSRPLIQLL